MSDLWHVGLVACRTCGMSDLWHVGLGGGAESLVYPLANARKYVTKYRLQT